MYLNMKRLFRKLLILMVLAVVASPVENVSAQRAKSRTRTTVAKKNTIISKEQKSYYNRPDMILLTDTVTHNVSLKTVSGKTIVPFSWKVDAISEQPFGFELYRADSIGGDSFCTPEGKLLIPLDRGFSGIQFDDFGKSPYMKPYKLCGPEGSQHPVYGIMDYEGREIIAPERGYIGINYKDSNDSFHPDLRPYFTVYGDDFKYYGVLDLHGREIISLDRKYTMIYQMTAQLLKDMPEVPFFSVVKDGRNGICDIYGNEIIPPIYDNVLTYRDDSFVTEINGRYESVGVALRPDGYAEYNSVASTRSFRPSEGYTSITNSTASQTCISVDGNVIRSNNGIVKQTQIFNPDGTATCYAEMLCMGCNGRGVCGVCFGAGGRNTRVGYRVCPSCAGSGICKSCHGKGYTTMTTFANGENAIGYSSTGNVHLGGGDASADNDKASSSSDRKRESTRGTKNSGNDGVEVIEYSPNYTGSEYRPWCEKCKDYMYPHAHVKKK